MRLGERHGDPELGRLRGEPALDVADGVVPSEALTTRNPFRGWRRAAVGLALPVLLLVGWGLASATGRLSDRLLPPPSRVLESGREFVVGEERAEVAGVVPFSGAARRHIAASGRRWAVAAGLAVVIGVPVGLALGLSRWLAAGIDPLFEALRSVPITAWLPIALVWFGLGEGAARFLVFVGAVSPIVIATADGTARVPRQLVDTARMLGTRRRSLAGKIYVPAALPGIVTGLRLGFTLGWMSVIVGELTGTSEGLGAMMFAARDIGRLDQILVGMAAFAVVGLAGDLLLRLAARPLVRWADA